MATLTKYRASQEEAHKLVGRAIKRGELIRPELCELCNDAPGRSSLGGKPSARPLIFAHHWNGYDNPLNVWFICASCNATLRNRHDGSISKNQARAIVCNRLEQYLHSESYLKRYIFMQGEINRP